jgi:hypothetical protein
MNGCDEKTKGYETQKKEREGQINGCDKQKTDMMRNERI